MGIANIAFINSVKGQAQRDMRDHKILASLIIAQAILESGWGQSDLTKAANNLFGVKLGLGWSGETVEMPTYEYYSGQRTKIIAKFRKYASWSDSIADHTRVLLKARYGNLIGVTDYKVACRNVLSDGYATDPNYADLLIEIIENYKLYEYDQEVMDRQLTNKLEGMINGMDIKTLQKWLNANNFTDENGNKLDEDGKEGTHTKAAKAKAKELLGYILR